MKNNFFAINGIPLLRFTASDVRENIADVIAQIISTADNLDKQEHILDGEVPVFKTIDMLRNERRKQLLRHKNGETT